MRTVAKHPPQQEEVVVSYTSFELDTALDSAFMHIPGNTATRRRAYTHQLAAVLAPGGWVHLLEISEGVTFRSHSI